MEVIACGTKVKINKKEQSRRARNDISACGARLVGQCMAKQVILGVAGKQRDDGNEGEVTERTGAGAGKWPIVREGMVSRSLGGKQAFAARNRGALHRGARVMT